LPAGVLLVRAAVRSRARAAAREVLPEFGVPLLDAEVPQKVAFVDSFGTAIEDLGAYEAVAAELGMLLGDDLKVS
jgi:chromosome partitioning protein